MVRTASANALQPVKRDGRWSLLRRSSAVQISAPIRNRAISRWADRRYGLTSVRPSSPDMTMNQPIAPCAPPRRNSAASRQP